MFFLANSPHPILDGVEEEAASNRTASNVESTHDIPVTTTYYPTDSEFIYPERKKCDAKMISVMSRSNDEMKKWRRTSSIDLVLDGEKK
jgi:hypothetical protein